MRSNGQILCAFRMDYMASVSFDRVTSAQSLRELHERGGRREDIEGALKIMPFVRPLVSWHTLYLNAPFSTLL